ncbi:integration host factor subunit alpha [Hydrogenophilus thermoluteolus]|nr:integration host factor subunit alpha [Hydrogenophilus thermoluteolus]MBW7656390.1 integration host factor subunit alpha [Hydrogenophilus thermoluteolus]
MAAELTKAVLTEILVEQVGIPRAEAKQLVECFFETITERLVAGETVKLSGFGVFEVRDKPQRPGRNPRTGEVVPIEPRRVVTFHASNKLKEAVAHHDLVERNPEREPAVV